MLLVMLSPEPETVNAPPVVAAPAHVKAPVKAGLARGAFKFKEFNTLVVPLIKLPETVKLSAVAVPVKAGLSRGAFKSKLAVVAFKFKESNTLSAPISKLPPTVQFPVVDELADDIAPPVVISPVPEIDVATAKPP